MSKPINEADETCPFNQKPVRKVCHKCPMYVQLRGHDPNTGNEIDTWGCAFSFMPMLTIENSLMQRQTGAAVESFRNEMVKSNKMMTAIAMAGRDKNLIEG